MMIREFGDAWLTRHTPGSSDMYLSDQGSVYQWAIDSDNVTTHLHPRWHRESFVVEDILYHEVGSFKYELASAMSGCVDAPVSATRNIDYRVGGVDFVQYRAGGKRRYGTTLAGSKDIVAQSADPLWHDGHNQVLLFNDWLVCRFANWVRVFNAKAELVSTTDIGDRISEPMVHMGRIYCVRRSSSGRFECSTNEVWEMIVRSEGVELHRVEGFPPLNGASSQLTSWGAYLVALDTGVNRSVTIWDPRTRSVLQKLDTVTESAGFELRDPSHCDPQLQAHVCRGKLVLHGCWNHGAEVVESDGSRHRLEIPTRVGELMGVERGAGGDLLVFRDRRRWGGTPALHYAVAGPDWESQLSRYEAAFDGEAFEIVRPQKSKRLVVNQVATMDFGTTVRRSLHAVGRAIVQALCTHGLAAECEGVDLVLDPCGEPAEFEKVFKPWARELSDFIRVVFHRRNCNVRWKLRGA